jgi:ABC-type Fe3+-siderophore transport system permease subunit
MQGTVVRSGIGFGSALAIVISYTAHKSVLWAIIHGVFSWFYVVYFLIKQ